MSYFNKFPLITYDIKSNKVRKLLPDILRRVKLRATIKSGGMLFDKYDVKEGEKPEDVAYKWFGDAELHWVIMMINNITDRYHDWPMTEAQFLQFIKDKYSNINGVHHYEITQTSGDTSIKIDVGTDNTNYSDATLITNYEYEQEQQDAKRKIRLLDPSYMSDFVEEFKSLMNESVI